MSEGWNNQRCPKCGRMMVLVSFYEQWRWKCPYCDIEKDREWYSTNTIKEANDER